MVEDKYFDGIGNIAVQGAVARVELTRVVSIAQSKEGNQQEVDMRLVLPLDALLKMYQALGQIVGQMEEKGVVKKRTQTDKSAGVVN